MIEIREMTIDDYHHAVMLWQAFQGLNVREADSETSIAAYLKRNMGLSFVAEHNRTLVGTVMAGTDGRRGYLQHLAVSAEYQGQGIGRALVEKALDALSGIGIGKTHLFVHADNQSAQDFYLKLGWFSRDDTRMFSFNASGNENI
jgi:ribosomal protein S18 acetylase RimI-like enzyme